ncbi:MAG: SDR family NAD(P)-dependent oxidoreductase, partial [Oceanobacter sp.]
EYDQIRYQFEVNSIAPLHMAEVLLPMMKEGSKIANITSRMGSMADNGSGGYYGYRASKAALNAFGKSMAMDLKSKGVAVALLHPGFVQTRMVNFSGDITAEQSAAGLLERIDHLSIENSGGFWHSNGQELPW